MAYPFDDEVQKVACRALKLFDSDPEAPGALHAQAQRFLNIGFSGVRSGTEEPPLRPLMERLALGSLTMTELLSDAEPTPMVTSFLNWVAAFRHVSSQNVLGVSRWLGCMYLVFPGSNDLDRTSEGCR